MDVSDLFVPNRGDQPSAYFTTRSGHRTMLVVFDLDDVARMPQIAEPLFMELQANVDFAPVRTEKT